jgi:alanine racemase
MVQAGIERSNDAARAPGATPWPCWIDVDLDAIAANVRAIRAWVGPRVRLVAVVKAQGYGLGARLVAAAALEAGADGLAVARVREGVRLRDLGVTSPMLLLAAFTPTEADTVVTNDLTPTVVEERQLALLSQAAERAGRQVPVHVKLDTGIRRYGAPVDEAIPVAASVVRAPNLSLDGFYTHFATADAPDLGFAREQLAAFQTACGRLEAQGIRPRYLHAANSAGTLAMREAHYDLVRVGLGIYGYYATPTVARTVSLQPAVTLRARVSRLLDVPAGCTVGYGRAYKATRPIRAALLTIGYADGLPGSHYRGGYVLLHGQRADIIGRISMDQCVVDVSHCPAVIVGDCAVVLGQQGDDSIALDEFAELSGSIPHEALTNLGSRVPRVYWQGGVVVATSTLAGEERLDTPIDQRPAGPREEAAG